VHLDRLVELEHVYAHSGRNGQRFIYELVFDGESQDSQPQLPGLIDVDQLNEATTFNLVASSADLVHGSWPACGELEASLSLPENTDKPCENRGSSAIDDEGHEKPPIPGKGNGASYDGQDVQVSRVHGCTGVTRSHAVPVLAAGVEG
jgi:hypothetical protein